MRFFKYILYLSLILCLSNTSYSQVKKDTLRILFVGNSYTYYSNMPSLVSKISDNTRTKLITSSITTGGAKLVEHWKGEKSDSIKKAIRKNDYDVVVIQGHSLGTIKNSNSFFKYAKKFCRLINNSGAKPYLFSTWAREYAPKKQVNITKAYKKAANEHNVEVVLVGEAWQKAKQLQPEIDLYDPDGSHPSPLGSFLTASIFVATFTKEFPENVTELPFVSQSKNIDAIFVWENFRDLKLVAEIALEYTSKKGK